MKKRTTMLLGVLLGGAMLLSLAQSSRAGELVISIGSGASIHRHHDGCGHRYRPHRSYHRYGRRFARRHPRVIDITPYRGHPPVYQVLPHRGRRPVVIVTPRRRGRIVGSYGRRRRCR